MLIAYVISRTAGECALAVLLFCDWTHRLPVATAAVVVPIDIVVPEVDVPRVARGARIKGRGPVEAVGTRIAEVGIVPFACGREENAVAIGGGNYSSTYSCTVIVCCPSPGTLCQ